MLYQLFFVGTKSECHFTFQAEAILKKMLITLKIIISMYLGMFEEENYDFYSYGEVKVF